MAGRTAPTEVHKNFAKYIHQETEKRISAEAVATVLRLYPQYLKTPEVVEAKEAERVAREAEKAEKAQARVRAAKERLAKIEAQRQKLLAEIGVTDLSPLVAVADRGTDDEGIVIEESVDEPEHTPKPAPKAKKAKAAPKEVVLAEDDDEDDWSFADDEEDDF